MIKFFKFALSIVLITISICSCGSKNAYRSDVACSAITDALEKEMATDGGYVHYGETELGYLFGDDISLATDSSVVYSLFSEDIDEFGIFKTDNEKNARELANECREYIEEKYENENAFIASYAPEELPKLRDAEVKVFSNYVAFAILDENDRTAFFEKVEKMLKAES